MSIEGANPRKTNDDLARRVKIFLSSRHQPAFRHLHIEAQGGTVTLRGKVGSFYEKQLSYQCCSRVAGVVKIVDQVDVSPTEHLDVELIGGLSAAD
jgi:osmotically-inducible protein OsmY